MARIGDIVTGSDITQMQAYMNKSIRTTAYVAPTIYRLASSSSIGAWPYYKSFNDAWQMLNWANGSPVSQPLAAGTVTFSKTAVAQTMGINVDFFVKLPIFSEKILVPYSFVREKYASYTGMVIVRFFKTTGEGPYWTVIHNKNFGIAATKLTDVPADKIAAMDDLQRSTQTFIAHHNAMAKWLTKMSGKTLSPTEQKYYNQGILMLGNMRQQIGQIPGIVINYGKSGAIGLFGIDDLIIGIVILAVVASYTVIKVKESKAQVDKVISNNDSIKFQSAFQLEVAKAVTAGLITKETGDALIKGSLQQQQDAANNNQALTKPAEGFMDQLMTIGKWGLGFYAVKIIADSFGNKKA